MKNKKLSKILSLCLALGCMTSAAVPAFADNTVSADNTATSIPVQIDARATVFDVTLPTALPTTVDPTTGETAAASNATIVNGSAGSIRVSEIKVVNKTSNALEAVETGWYLKDYDNYDFHNADVDSNGVGISVKSVGGRSAETGGTALKTDASSESLQTLLTYTKGGANNTASADEWVLDAKTAESNSDELTVSYDTRATSVSQDIVNQQVASIIITVAWNKG